MWKQVVYMKYALYISTLLLMITTSSKAQSGLNVYTGISSASSPSEIITTSGERNQGYLLGADARLNSGNMYFLLSGQYHVINFNATEGSFFSVEENMSWLKLRFGLGFNLINFSDKVALRAKALLSIDSIVSAPEIDNMDLIFNASTAGGHLGVGLDFYAFTFDIEYEKGFFNAVNMVPSTTLDFITAYVGVRF